MVYTKKQKYMKFVQSLYQVWKLIKDVCDLDRD